jgi:hypothetical protein
LKLLQDIPYVVGSQKQVVAQLLCFQSGSQGVGGDAPCPAWAHAGRSIQHGSEPHMLSGAQPKSCS